MKIIKVESTGDTFGAKGNATLKITYKLDIPEGLWSEVMNLTTTLNERKEWAEQGLEVLSSALSEKSIGIAMYTPRFDLTEEMFDPDEDYPLMSWEKIVEAVKSFGEYLESLVPRASLTRDWSKKLHALAPSYSIYVRWEDGPKRWRIGATGRCPRAGWVSDPPITEEDPRWEANGLWVSESMEHYCADGELDRYVESGAFAADLEKLRAQIVQRLNYELAVKLLNKVAERTGMAITYVPAEEKVYFASYPPGGPTVKKVDVPFGTPLLRYAEALDDAQLYETMKELRHEEMKVAMKDHAEKSKDERKKERQALIATKQRLAEDWKKLSEQALKEVK